MTSALSQDQLAEALRDPQLRRWVTVSGQLRRDYQFSSFVEAFSFMSAIALHAEAMNHHPELHNVHSRVGVSVYSPDAQGVTELDLELARRIEKQAAGRAVG